MSIESVMPSNHLILCRPLLLLPSIFPSIRVFSNESDAIYQNQNAEPASLGASKRMRRTSGLMRQTFEELSSWSKKNLPSYWLLYDGWNSSLYLQGNLQRHIPATHLKYHLYYILANFWRRKWQLTPVFLPGESHGQESDRLQSNGSQRVRHDGATTHTANFTYISILRKYNIICAILYIIIYKYFLPLAYFMTKICQCRTKA